MLGRNDIMVTSTFHVYLYLQPAAVYRRKMPAAERLSENTHLAEMGNFTGKFEILRTIKESAIFQQARNEFGFPAS